MEQEVSKTVVHIWAILHWSIKQWWSRHNIMILKCRSNDDDNYFSWFYDSMIVGDIFALLQSLTHHKSFPLVCDTYGQSHSQPVINIARNYVPRSSPIFDQWFLSWISIIQLIIRLLTEFKKKRDSIYVKLSLTCGLNVIEQAFSKVSSHTLDSFVQFE